MESTKPLLRALRRETTQNVPFWFMRQAGRYLPEYRELRAKSGDFLKMVYNPAVACEITLQPIRRFGMDAAIIFSDILTIPQALGQKLEFLEGEGPKLDALRSGVDIGRLNFKNFESTLSPVYEALRQTKSALERGGFSNTALIGFSGAPWTLAAYMIEGGGSDDYAIALKFARENPKDFMALMDTLVESIVMYLGKQIDAGAEAVQIFDSHAGVLSDAQFESFAIKPIQKIVQSLKQKHPVTPVIGFPRRAGNKYEAYAKTAGVTALGLDQGVDTKWAAKTLQPLLSLQGNLDPEVMLRGGDELKAAAMRILDDLSAGPFIFNLGHGVIKETPVEHVEALVKIIRDYKRA